MMAAQVLDRSAAARHVKPVRIGPGIGSDLDQHAGGDGFGRQRKDIAIDDDIVQWPGIDRVLIVAQDVVILRQELHRFRIRQMGKTHVGGLGDLIAGGRDTVLGQSACAIIRNHAHLHTAAPQSPVSPTIA